MATDMIARALAARGSSFVSPTGSGLLVYSGTVIKPTWTYNVGGTITIGEGTYRFYHSDDYSGVMTEHVIPETTLDIDDDTTSYIIASYNNGSPHLVVITDYTQVASSTDSQNVIVYTVYRYADDPSVIDWDEPGLGLANKIHRRLIETRRFDRVSGLGLGEIGTRNITITAGKVWEGSYSNSLLVTDSATDDMYLRINNGNGTWTRDAVTQYPNTQWDNASGTLQTLTDGNYAVIWAYRSMSNSKKVHIVLGAGDYDLSQAKASQPPEIPNSLVTNTMLVGRLIVSKGSDTATLIESAFDTTFAPSITTVHNNLTQIEGGDGAHYYHSDQSINKVDDVEFNSLTTNLINANEATTSVSGLMSASDKAKLDGLVAPAKNNLTANTPPTVENDSSEGYSEGSTWIYGGITYTCVEATEDNAIWVSSDDTLYVEDAVSMTVVLSTPGTGYIGKFITVANANGAPSSGTYTAPNPVTNQIVDGGMATYKILAQGASFSIETQPRTITNPVITAVRNLSQPKPTSSGYYIFTTVNPSDGLPGGVSLNDVAYYNGTSWSKYQSYAQANITVSVGTTTSSQVAWTKAAGTWQQTSGLSYMSGYKTVNSGVATGSIINFVVGDNFNMGEISPPNIPLKAGRSYEIRAFTQVVGSAACGARFAFVNASGGAEIASLAQGVSYTTTFTAHNGSQPVSGGFYTPSSDVNLNFKCVSHSGSPELQFETFRIEVKQLK